MASPRRRRFDLDDLRAQQAQQVRRIGPRHHVTEIRNADALEHLPHASRLHLPLQVTTAILRRRWRARSGTPSLHRCHSRARASGVAFGFAQVERVETLLIGGAEVGLAMTPVLCASCQPSSSARRFSSASACFPHRDGGLAARARCAARTASSSACIAHGARRIRRRAIAHAQRNSAPPRARCSERKVSVGATTPSITPLASAEYTSPMGMLTGSAPRSRITVEQLGGHADAHAFQVRE